MRLMEYIFEKFVALVVRWEKQTMKTKKAKNRKRTFVSSESNSPTVSGCDHARRFTAQIYPRVIVSEKISINYLTYGNCSFQRSQT